MNVLLYGTNSKNIEGLVKKLDFEVVSASPDVVISYGGDGTLLSSERQYPGIPKLPIRNSQFCHKCPNHQDEVVLKKLLVNQLKLEEYKKLHTNVNGEDLHALNDFVVRNDHPVHAIRFQINNSNLLVGDGVVIATSFGSTGYFKSITRQTFDKGFGLAFNNTTEIMDPIFFEEQSSASFKLLRGTAHLTFDNSPDILPVNEGSHLIFKLSNQVVKIYEDTSLRCPNCQIIRG